MAEPVGVEVRDVAAGFGATEVLRGVSFSVQPGEFFALLGPSGSGKSTLLRVIAGFNAPRRGAVLIAGEDVSRVPPWRRDVGMVFQNYALWPHMSVAQNVAFGLEERRLARADVRRRVAEALDLVGLAGLDERRPGELSGGQQQRVALARTLAIEPKVLLLDEPLSNLDAKLRVHMRRELVALQERLGITTLFVTHDQEEAMTTADRVAVLDQGVIQQIGSPEELYDEPATRFVAEFIGTINLLAGEIGGSAGASVRFDCAAGALNLPWIETFAAQKAVTLAFRPHSVSVARVAADEGRIWVPGTVAEREFLGESVRYRVRVRSADLIAELPHRAGDAEFAPGAAVQLGIDPGQIRVLRG